MTHTTQLGELMVRGQQSVDPRKTPEEAFELYSIPAYDHGKADSVCGHEIGSAKKAVEPGDVLLSRIVPHIRRAWVVPETNGERQIASGEWIVFRHPSVQPRYLRHLLMSDSFHAHFMNTVAGVGGSLVRARPENVGRIKVVLPSLSEQKRIADILDKADAIRGKRQKASQTSAHLIESGFSYLFGDTFLNPNGFTMGELHELAGAIVDCPHSTPKYSEAKTEFFCVRSSDIQEGFIDLTQTRFVSEGTYARRIARHVPLPGQVVYTREGGRLGNAAQIPPATKMCLGQRMMLFAEKPDVSTNEFIWALLNSPGIRHQVNSLVSGAAAPRINIADIRKFRVPLAPYELQLKFTGFIEKLREQSIHVENSRKQSDDLFNSLVQRAFKGEL